MKHRKGVVEGVLLTLAWLAFLLPLLWVVTSVLSFADYPLHPAPYGAGALLLVAGLWLFHRSHADLGSNWSITLELRENHSVVTHGVYRKIRHPMYLGLLLYGTGQALAVSNWLAGPSYLAAMILVILFRIGFEERMMRDHFGGEYEAYAARTQRLVPGLW